MYAESVREIKEQLRRWSQATAAPGNRFSIDCGEFRRGSATLVAAAAAVHGKFSNAVHRQNALLRRKVTRSRLLAKVFSPDANRPMHSLSAGRRALRPSGVDCRRSGTNVILRSRTSQHCEGSSRPLALVIQPKGHRLTLRHREVQGLPGPTPTNSTPASRTRAASLEARSCPAAEFCTPR